MLRCSQLIVTLSLLAWTQAVVINFEDVGAAADQSSEEVEWLNGGLLNTTLAKLVPGDVLWIPNKTFHVMGGIKASGLRNVSIRIDGTLKFSPHVADWPCSRAKEPGPGPHKRCHSPLEVIDLEGEDVTLTASGKGILDGNGPKWWGVPGLGYLYRGEDRPRLLHIHGKRWLIENLLLKDSPYWTFKGDVEDLEIRFTDIDAWRVSHEHHTAIDMTAFNTDGFDVTGKNVWIHDCNVWNQDDSFCVKGMSENMVFERVNSSGRGLTIGSIGNNNNVRNITFRDAYMHHTMNGVYVKFRSSGHISNVLFENIVMDAPEHYPIWIGPAQQSDSSTNPICNANPCSVCWPDWRTAEFGPLCLSCKEALCNGVEKGVFENITLRNIIVNNPKRSAGVLIAHADYPMKNVVFDNVRVNNPGPSQFGDDQYHCENVQGVATGGTTPVPSCLRDETSSRMVEEQLV